MIIFLAEMAEPNMAKCRSGIIGECLSTGIIAQVTGRTKDAVLLVLRIIALLKHLNTVISLNDEIVGTTDEIVHFVGDMSHICNEAEAHTTTFHKVTYVIGTVMRNAKGSDTKLTYSERHTLLYHMHILWLYFLSHTIVAIDALMHLARGIYGQVVVVAQAPHRLHMVGMVMSNQDVMYVLEAQSIVMEMLLQTSKSYSYVYKK